MLWRLMVQHFAGASLGFIVARTVRSLEGSSGGTQILNDSNPIDMSHLFAMAHNDPTGYAVIGGVREHSLLS